MLNLGDVKAGLVILAMLLPLQALAEIKILDVDPSIVAPHEKQTWAKVLNEGGNDAVTLNVFRVDTAKDIRVDGIRRSGISSKSRIDIPMAVKKTWFVWPLKDGEYKFRVELIDAKSKVRDRRDFAVQAQQALAKVLYHDDGVSWAAASEHAETSVLVTGRVKSIDWGREVLRLDVASREVDVTFDRSKNQLPSAIRGKMIDAYIGKAGGSLAIRDVKVNQ